MKIINIFFINYQLKYIKLNQFRYYFVNRTSSDIKDFNRIWVECWEIPVVRVSWPNLDQNYRPMFNPLHEGFCCKKRTWPIN